MTKSKNARGRGGFRKGAGRPRLTKSGKTSYFSTRITPEARALLEAESRLSGQSLSQTAERLLLIGLREKQERSRDDPIRALCFLITLISERVSGPFGEPEYNWRTNPFMFEAFRMAVSHMLDALRPAGKIVAPSPERAAKRPSDGPFAPPPNFVSDALDFYFDTPEHRGRDAAWHLLCELRLYDPPTRSQSKDTAQRFGRDFADTLAQLKYGLADARQDLAVAKEEQLK